MDDLKREHRWRHWEGHWEERIQQAGREGGSMQQEQEAGGEAKEGRQEGQRGKGGGGKGSPGNTCSHNRDSQSGIITRIPISFN